MLGLVVLLVFRWINPTQTSAIIAERHGLPMATGTWILPVVAGFGLYLCDGDLRKKSDLGFPDNHLPDYHPCAIYQVR